MPEGRTVVVGLGNPIMGDDGLGLAALRRLAVAWHVPDEIQLVEGGTWGLTLLPVIERADRVLLLDAIHLDAAPGTILRVERDELPRAYTTRMSPHQVDLMDVLALATWRGTLPASVVAIGAQPAVVDMVVGLSPVLEEAVDRVAAAAAERLRAWGHACARRETIGASGQGERESCASEFPKA